MNLQERKKYSRLVELVNRRFESRFYPKLQKAIKQDISSLIEYLKINGIDSAPKYFDDNIASKSLTEIVQDLYSNVGVYHANRVYRDLRKEEKGFGFNADFINFVTNYFRKHLVEKITFGAVKTMRDFFLPLISKAVTDGATFEEIAQAIRDKGFEKRQAARIVRTEVNSATNVAAVAAAEKFEYKTMKEWISGHDHRVRGRNPEDHANHWGLDGVIINYEDYFIDPRNKVQLFQPGDPKARGLSRDVAATTINCRCTIALSGKRGKDGKLIKK